MVRHPILKDLSLFLSVLQQIHATYRRSHDGTSCTTVLKFRDPIPMGFSLFLSVLQQTHATDRCSHDGPSCITVLVVRDPILRVAHLF